MRPRFAEPGPLLALGLLVGPPRLLFTTPRPPPPPPPAPPPPPRTVRAAAAPSWPTCDSMSVAFRKRCLEECLSYLQW